jgi:hypothetical protein
MAILAEAASNLADNWLARLNALASAVARAVRPS